MTLWSRVAGVLAIYMDINMRYNILFIKNESFLKAGKKGTDKSV